jgi:predicted MFS family arabinose efflux permease
LLADAVRRRSRDLRWSRRLTGAGALLLAALAVLAVRLADSALAVTLCNAAALFFLQVSLPSWWAVVAEVSGRHGAALWGLMNSMAGLGLMAVNVLVGWVVEERQALGYTPLDSWGPVFDGVALGLAVGAVCWLRVDATRSAVSPTDGARA